MTLRCLTIHIIYYYVLLAIRAYERVIELSCTAQAFFIKWIATIGRQGVKTIFQIVIQASHTIVWYLLLY